MFLGRSRTPPEYTSKVSLNEVKADYFLVIINIPGKWLTFWYNFICWKNWSLTPKEILRNWLPGSLQYKSQEFPSSNRLWNSNFSYSYPNSSTAISIISGYLQYFKLILSIRAGLFSSVVGSSLVSESINM